MDVEIRFSNQLHGITVYILPGTIIALISSQYEILIDLTTYRSWSHFKSYLVYITNVSMEDVMCLAAEKLDEGFCKNIRLGERNRIETFSLNIEW